MDKEAVKITNLWYKYSGDRDYILKNVNLVIQQGSFYVLSGPSGSGKSSLLALIRGFYQEIGGGLKGEIQVFGQNVNKISIAELGKTIGIVFQNPALQLHQLRVIDEVASSMMYQGFPYEECQKKAALLIKDFVGEDLTNCSPQELSGGQQQRVALAASLALDAEILLLDEPFSFLDENAKNKLLKMLETLHRNGKTVIIATHDIAYVANLATQMGLMQNGKLVISGTPQNVLYSNKFSSVMPPPLLVQVSKKLGMDTRYLVWEKLLPKLIVKKLIGKKTFLKKRRAELSLKKISFNYQGTNNGVKNISLDIYDGEIFGLIGVNGSGKTTLAKIILGLVKPKKGRITLKGRDITIMPTEERAKDIGYVTQDPLDMFFESNLQDEVAAGPKFLDLPNPKQSAEKALRKFNLWQYKDKHPDSISGGEKSRLGIADIVVNNTSVLVLDEPEFGLDPKSWEDVEVYLKELKQSGKTIIVITQNLEIAFFLCDRIGVMGKGQIVGVGQPVKILQDKKLLDRVGLTPLMFYSLLKQFPDNFNMEKEKFLNSLVLENKK